MVQDVCGLVRNDHDDLDRALAAMVDLTTTSDELVRLLEVFRLALAVHLTAETKVFDLLVARGPAPGALRMIVEQTRREHAAQQEASDGLFTTEPRSNEWYARALDLRILVLDHASRGDLLRWTLHDHLSLEQHRALARDYATERLIALSRTSPTALAREQLAASYM
jgi:hypothetical protein